MTRGVIVGLGHMGRYHHRTLALLPDVEVDTVDPDPAAHATYRTLSAALSAGGYDFACIATPVEALASIARQALAGGLAVLVEKPLASCPLHAEGIIQDAAERGLLLSVGFTERFNRGVLELRDRLVQVGRIHSIHARRLSPPPSWALRRHGSVVQDLATHDLDVIQWLTNRTPRKICAHGNRDLVCAVMRLDGGAVATIEANWITPAKVRELTITGENGMFVLNYATQELNFYERTRVRVAWEALATVSGPGSGDRVSYGFERSEPLAGQWKAFLTALARGGPAPVPGENAVQVLAVAEEIERHLQ